MRAAAIRRVSQRHLYQQREVTELASAVEARGATSSSDPREGMLGFERRNVNESYAPVQMHYRGTRW